MDYQDIAQYINDRIDHVILALDALQEEPEEDGKTNVNAKPFFVGKWMILSDQDMTALKHHILSSAVMGTVFAGIIAWVAQPTVPFYVKALVLGGLLTGAQALLVAVSNVGILVFEYAWPRRAQLGRACLHGCGRCARAIGSAYMSSHLITLDNGTTVWIDGFESVVVEEGTEP